MKTLIILWKRFWADSPAILKRVRKMVLTFSLALVAASGGTLAVIGQYEYEIQWKEWLIGVLVFSTFVSSFLTGLNLATTDEHVQNLSDPETGLPK